MAGRPAPAAMKYYSHWRSVAPYCTDYRTARNAQNAQNDKRAVLRIVLVTVPRAGRSCEHFPDVFDPHRLQQRGEHLPAEMWVVRVGGEMGNSDPGTKYTYTAMID